MPFLPNAALLLISLMSIIFTTSAVASSNQDALQILHATANDLNKKIDSDWILSRERNLTAWLRMKAVRQASYDGEDLSFLQKHGLEKKSPTWYEVNLKEHPEWMTAYRLLMPLSSWRGLPEHQAKLYELGMTVVEVNRLTGYILANDIQEITIQAALDFLREEESTYVSRFLQGGEDFSLIYLEFVDKFYTLSHVLETDWAIGLFNLFDRDGQDILLTYSLSKVNSRIGLGKSNFSLDEKVDIFMGYFLSGGFHASTKESLQRHKERRRADRAQINVEFKPPTDKAVNECRCAPKQCSYTNH
ncbi:hypothetical protein [Microbulbifer sp. JMSA008]|uniref:hypothetical protein n=1 Tax=Microbulbifer sp. JMSA008 TaxID=3243373 RepID=UPI004039F1FE